MNRRDLQAILSGAIFGWLCFVVFTFGLRRSGAQVSSVAGHKNIGNAVSGVTGQGNANLGGGVSSVSSGNVLPAGSVFVAANGSDSNPGTKASPWLTIAKVNATAIPAGAFVSFRGGDTFSDAVLNPQSGTSGKVTTFTSYGTGQAAISNSDTTITKSPINGTNASWFMISNLTVLAVSNNGTTGGRNCIFLVNNTSSGAVYQGRYFVSNTIVGGGTGIWLDNQSSDVSSNDYVFGNSISNCSFSAIDWANDVQDGGATPHKGIFHKSPYCAGNLVYNIPGNPQFAYGVIMGYVANGVFESNTVHRVGYNSTVGTAGPGGMFPIGATNVLMRWNEVYDVHGSFDAIGLDCDINTSNCIVEYNYIHDCQGAGLINFTTVATDTGNVFRFNKVKNCGGSLQGGVDLYYPCTFYNNTVTAPANPAILTASSGSKVYNNSFTTRGDHAVNYSSGTTEDYNQYWGYVNPVFTFNGVGYTSLTLYRVGSSQGAHSLLGDANLFDPYRTNSVNNPAQVAGQVDMEPTTGSCIEQAGANLLSLFSINPGPIDAKGNALRTPYSMGAIDGTFNPATPIPEVFWYKYSSLGYSSTAQINNSVFANLASTSLFPQTTTAATVLTPNGYGSQVFGGTDDNFVFAPNANLDQAVGSWSVWFKTTQVSGNNMLMSRAQASGSLNGAYVYINGSGIVVGNAANGSTSTGVVQSGSGFNDGNWHNMVFGFSESASGPFKLYIDGALVQSNNTTGAWSFNTTLNFYTGKAQDTFWNGFVGNIADERFYSHLVTDAEAALLGAHPPTANLQ